MKSATSIVIRKQKAGVRFDNLVQAQVTAELALSGAK
jgi:hypothetical protein